VESVPFGAEVSDQLYNAAFAIVLLLLVWSFYRAQRDPANSFNLFDLIMENGRISRIGFAFLVALLVTSWVLVKMASNATRNLDVVFSAYLAAWVAPIVAKLFSPPLATTSTQTSTSTTTTAPAPKAEEKHES
jgi:hypothetical protein